MRRSEPIFARSQRFIGKSLFVFEWRRVGIGGGGLAGGAPIGQPLAECWGIEPRRHRYRCRPAFIAGTFAEMVATDSSTAFKTGAAYVLPTLWCLGDFPMVFAFVRMPSEDGPMSLSRGSCWSSSFLHWIG